MKKKPIKVKGTFFKQIQEKKCQYSGNCRSEGWRCNQCMHNPIEDHFIQKGYLYYSTAGDVVLCYTHG